jgi:8-oxo-dGTP diphosphatase
VGVSLPLALRRMAYRLAYRCLQVFWFFARPHKQGVKCLVTHDGQVLLVRHTYGRRSWDLPGGALKRGEPPLVAATREMNEELGLDDVVWRSIGELHGRVDCRRDTIHLFTTDLRSPQVHIDLAELAMSGWFERGRLPADLAPYVEPILIRALG